MNTNSFFYFWLKNLRTSFLLIILIIVSGIFALYSIPKESTPDIKFGIISISVSYPGVNPEDMDSLITEKIESEIEDLEGVKKISSTSGVGMSSISVELETDANTRDLLTDIKDRVDSLSLPEDASDPMVQEVSTSNTLMYETLLYGDRKVFDDFNLMQKAKKIQSQLEGTSGVASIDFGGVSSKRIGGSSSSDSDYDIKVLLSKSKVELLGLSITNIANTIKSNNKDTPIGNYRVGDLSYDFRFEGELDSLEELKNIVIKDNGSSQIKLNDIAKFEIEYSGDDIQRIGFGKESEKKIDYNYVSLAFNKSAGANIFDSSKTSKKALEELLKSDSDFEGLEIIYSKDMSEIIKEDYSNLGNTAISTIVLVFLTILFFVGFREGVIASLLIPLAFMITFIVLDAMGLSMNFLTNFSLVLTLGIAIDTVIVIIEGASEKMKLGFSKKSAIILAIRDFKSPLISGTSTTLVAFLPLIFLPGIMGKFLSFIPITVFVTLVAALFLSLTLASAMFVKIMKSDKTYHKEEKLEKNMKQEDILMLQKDRENKIEKNIGKLSLRERFLHSLGKIYENTLNKVFSRGIYRLSFVFIPFILLIFSFVILSPRIGFTVFPQTDEGVINIEIKGKVGAKEDYMNKFSGDISNILNEIPEVKMYTLKVSGNTTSVYIDLLDKKVREEKNLLSSADLGPILEDKLSFLKSDGLELNIQAQKGGPPGGSAVGIKLSVNSAKNFDLLKEVSEDFEKELNNIKGAKNVFSSSSDSPGQFIFKFNKQKLSNVGLNQNDILNELYFYTNGIKAGSIKSGTEDNEIILSFEEFEKFLNPEEINNIIVNTRIGKVRVGDFANFEFKKSVNNISREDTKIVIEVGSEVQNGYLPTDIQPQIEKFASTYNFPNGITYMNGGEGAENKELIISTIKSLFIAIFLIFSILVFQFNSFRQPAIVLYSIILALLGVNIGLFVTGNPYSMPFMIGFIALTGIVVNDAIILIDRINKGIKNAETSPQPSPLGGEGVKVDYIEQLIIAGKSRLQPIIVTTLTTVFGVLPLALQDEFWAGLGYTIIFGLFVGSFMTLIVVPLLYYYLVLRKKIKRRKL